jgi:hypothetical protein
VVKNTPGFAALKRAGAKRGTAEFGSTDAEERAAIAKSIHELVKASGLTMEEFRPMQSLERCSGQFSLTNIRPNKPCNAAPLVNWFRGAHIVMAMSMP